MEVLVLVLLQRENVTVSSQITGHVSQTRQSRVARPVSGVVV